MVSLAPTDCCRTVPASSFLTRAVWRVAFAQVGGVGGERHERVAVMRFVAVFCANEVLAFRQLNIWVCVYSSHLFWRQSLRSRRDVYYTLQCTTSLHFFSYCTCSVYFSAHTRTSRGRTGGGNTGAFLFFFFFFFFFAPPSSCGACIRFYREKKGSAVPFPRRQ